MTLHRRLAQGWLDNELLVLGCALVGVAIAQATQRGRIFDDAYITFRYARNISQGLGFVYNQGQHVLGTTTPLYTLFLALVAWLTGSVWLPAIAFYLSLIVDAVNVWLVFRLARWVFKESLVAWLVAAVFLLYPLRIVVSGGGMETAVFIALLLLMYDSYLIRDHWLAASVWAGLLFLTRPDGLLAVIPVFVLSLLRDWKQAIRMACLCCLVVVPWLVWASLYFGSPIPNSVVAKGTAYPNPPGHALLFMLAFFGTGTANITLPAYLLLPLIGIGLCLISIGVYKLARREPAALAVAAYPLLYGLVMAWQNPPMWFPWYYPPLVPGTLLSIVEAVRFDRWSARWRTLMVAAVLAVVIAVPLLIGQQETLWDPTRERERTYWAACRVVKDGIAPGDLVLAPDIGVVGWCLAEANILDPIGLVSPEALRYLPPTMTRQSIFPELVSDYAPRYIISSDYFVGPELASDPFFQSSYRLLWQQDLPNADHTILVFRREEQTKP